MSVYTAPLRDMLFTMKEVGGLEAICAQPGHEETTPDLVEAILQEAAHYAAGVLDSLNRTGDVQGARWHDGEVTPADGFREAWSSFCENGWIGMPASTEWGGQGLPTLVSTAVLEMWKSSNLAFSLCQMLTLGAVEAIAHHGSEALKQRFLEPMVAGRWTGTMNLTEPQAGSDLAALRSRAVPEGDHYRISGSKIFITGGEQDLTENIIHLVLAKLPDAPTGPKGISLFLVPKIKVNADGSLGAGNAVSCGSIEHKMGIKASATCVMNFDGAEGYLIGEENKGLAAMFTMMNYERLSIGIQGIGCAEASYQSAVAYARERIQSRAPSGPQVRDKVADPIIVHPDVRRMLLTIKAMTEGGRAFASYVGQQLDLSKFSEDVAEKQAAENLVALLTPVAKAFFTDSGLESTVYGQQVLGGHGYIREWGQEQLVRDVRIAQIYEGTNGIQALDLLGRKVVANGGAALRQFTAEVRAFATADAPHRDALLDAVQRLENTTDWLLLQAKGNPNEVGAASVEFLHLFGYVAYAWLWSRMAQVAANMRSEDAAFYDAKLATAGFYFRRLLPRILSLEAAIRAGSEPLFGLGAEQF
ncbi:acyl-CoA dehydrogenase C-terminal domain-containing protein [Stutzerimonas sp. 381-2]|jgi:alkylation response protein AidB-like acyl-CoA dehydrogenase